MNSYGKFKDFEIRDYTVVTEVESAEDIETKEINAELEGRYDLVKWEDYMDQKYCFSIARLIWNKNEGWFEFESVGTRYLEYGTEELNEWLLRWCKLKQYERSKDE